MTTKMKWARNYESTYHNKYKIILELDDNLVLQNKQVQNMTSNKKYWWIKKNFSSFVEFIQIEQIEGNNKFKMDLELERGNYTIGCGTYKNGIRKDFRVSNDEHIFIH